MTKQIEYLWLDNLKKKKKNRNFYGKSENLMQEKNYSGNPNISIVHN